MSTRPKVLFIIGSPNQTTQMHEISKHLPDCDCYFSQFFGKSWNIRMSIKSGLMEQTIISGEFRRKGDQYLADHGLMNDYMGEQYGNTYDMVVNCTDLIVPMIARKSKSIWVQEGMTDPITRVSYLVKGLGLAGYFAADTSLNGTGNICDVYCCASEGYKEHFVQWGTDRKKLLVTGITNFDNAARFLDNDFPYRDYVMVATSDIRELWGKDDRESFIQESVRTADGRPMLFKLHPNEHLGRAVAEIRRWAPADAIILQDGSTDHMIANCSELITQYSTVVYTGIALGKKVHSYFDLEDLRSKAPIQNGGTTAKRIAGICQRYLDWEGSKEAFLESEHSRSEDSKLVPV